jgi:hypothetical protein
MKGSRFSEEQIITRAKQLNEGRNRALFRRVERRLPADRDSLAERGGFEPPVPLAFIRVAFGPSLAPYSGAERNPFKLQTYSDCRLASNPILLISIGRPSVEASRDRDTSTEQRGTRHYVVVWLFRTRYRQFEFTLLRYRVWNVSALCVNR